MKRVLLALVILGAIAVGLAYASLYASYRGFREPVIVDFPKGTSTRAMADELAQNGVIRYPWQFLMARALHSGQRAASRRISVRKAPTRRWTS